MAYIDNINLAGGESLDDGIKFYLELQEKKITNSTTTLTLNDTKYPIGLFDEESMHVFKTGFNTLWNISDVLYAGGRKFDEKYLEVTDRFIDEVFDAFDSNYMVKAILNAFSDIAYDRGYILFSPDQVDAVHDRLAEREKKLTDSMLEEKEVKNTSDGKTK